MENEVGPVVYGLGLGFEPQALLIGRTVDPKPRLSAARPSSTGASRAAVEPESGTTGEAGGWSNRDEPHPLRSGFVVVRKFQALVNALN